MSSSLRVNTIVPSTGTNVAIGTANGTVTFTDSVNFVLGTGSSIFSPASNTLTFGTNDAERLRITSTGNVGVKVTDPDLTLHVNGVNALPSTSGSTPTGHLTLRAKASSSTHGMFMGVSNASPWSSWIQAQDANNNATNYPLLLNPNGGNIGIGTDNPNGLLALTANSGRILTLRNSTTGSASGDGSYLALNGSDFQIANAESANIILYTADTERLRLDDVGRLTITGQGLKLSATASSLYSLDGSLSYYSTSNGVYLNGAGTNGWLRLNAGGVENNHNAINIFGGAAGAYISMHTSNNERVRINSSGDATFRQKVFIGDLYTGGEILSLGKSSGTSYMAFHNGGANMGFIGYADQLISGGASNELGIRSQDDIRFSTGGNTERLRISNSTITCATGVGMAIDGGTSQQSSDSSLLVTKQNNNDWALQVRNYEGSSTDYGFYSRSKNAASYAIAVYDADNSVFRFRVNGGGSIYATNTTVSSISDQRLKENIVDANSQWDDIKALRFRNFNWREDSGFSDGRTYLGLIAQEVEPISPNLVDINAQSKEDIENEVPDPEYKNVKYSIVWMKAVKALQEAQTRIETLETQLTDALARITALEG